MNIPDTGLVLLHFTATWCGPCRSLKPILDQVVQDTGIERVTVDIDQHQDVPEQYQVMSVPTLVLLRDGEKVSDMVGLRSSEVLTDWISKNN